MKSTPHKIVMTNPCHENWEEMTQSSKGKFCASCKTDVIDFTQMSNNEIIDYFKSNKITKGCGRFYKKQLDAIQIPVDEKIFSYDLKQWQKFLVVLLFCFGQELVQVQLVFTQETNGDTTFVSEVVDSILIDSADIQLNELDDFIITKPKKIKVESTFKTINITHFIMGSITPINGGFGIVDQRRVPKCLKPNETFSPEMLETKHEYSTIDKTDSINPLKKNQQKDDDEKNRQTQNQSMILPNLITFRKTRRKKK